MGAKNGDAAAKFIVSVSIAQSYVDLMKYIAYASPSGDAIAFDSHTVQGAPDNLRRQQSRRVVSFRWLVNSAHHVDRGGETPPPYPELAGRLASGDPLPEAAFPFIDQVSAHRPG